MLFTIALGVGEGVGGTLGDGVGIAVLPLIAFPFLPLLLRHEFLQTAVLPNRMIALPITEIEWGILKAVGQFA